MFSCLFLVYTRYITSILFYFSCTFRTFTHEFWWKLKTLLHMNFNTCWTTHQDLTSRHRNFYSRVVTTGRLVKKPISNRSVGTTRQDLTSHHRNYYSRVVKSGWLVTEAIIHELSRVDDSWQKHLFTSRDTCTTRHTLTYQSNMHCIHPFPIIHAYFYKLVYYPNNLFIYFLFFYIYQICPILFIV